MSGAEVIGLISSALTVLDTVIKLYGGIKNSHRLPQAFREVALKLPLVRDTLKSAEGRIRQNDTDAVAYGAIKSIVESCNERAELLKNILQEIAPEPSASRFQRYRLAVRRLGKESQVEELMKGMLEDAHLLAGNRAIKAASETQFGELLKAIQDLSRVPPSVPDAPRHPTFAHYGTGHQFNNSGSGTQNINTGNGEQFIAHTMTFRGH